MTADTTTFVYLTGQFFHSHRQMMEQTFRWDILLVTQTTASKYSFFDNYNISWTDEKSNWYSGNRYSATS